MRFRKSIKICKGVRLNLSKSGVSATVGIKGASVNFGKKGTYVNYGIPGTGIYDRKKISGGNSKKDNFYDFDWNSFHINYKDDGSMDFYINGNLITDAYIIRMIKKEEHFKNILKKINEERIELYKNIDKEYTDIQRYSAKVPHNMNELLDMYKPQPETFNEYEIPSDEILSKEAMNKISILKFWKRKQLVKKYIDDKKAYYQQEKLHHDAKETNRVNQLNKERELQYEEFKANIKFINQGNTDILDDIIGEWLNSIEFPFEFNIEYEICNKKIYIDIDLPNIEDFPSKKTQELKSGIVKIKDKTQKEQREDYSKCVYGMAILFASIFFRFAININDIIVSEYTQRRNKKGLIQDDYILSVKFTREKFVNLDYKNDPRENILIFENACLQQKNNDFKKIVPFSEE